MTDRLARPWPGALCLALACIALAGCGAGSSGSPGSAPSPAGAPAPALALTAPTTGATVGVHQIEVVGTVTPQNAVVRVAGQPATTSQGKFRRAVWLRRPTTTIQITAAAPGHAPTAFTTVVHFSQQLAVALVAARKASVSTATRAVASVTASPTPTAPAVPPARHPAGMSTARASGTTSPPSSTTSTTTTPSPGAATSGGSGTATSTPTSSGAGSTPSAPAPLTPAQIEQRYLKGCTAADGGQSALAYCTCMYDRLAQAGALASPATIAALAQELKEFGQTQDIFALPAFLRNSLADCASQLPNPTLPVNQLPRLDHPSAGPKATTASRPG
jgi:hypothetical protein